MESAPERFFATFRGLTRVRCLVLAAEDAIFEFSARFYIESNSREMEARIYANNSMTGFAPSTPVSFWSNPWNLKEKRSLSMPMHWRMVDRKSVV